MRCQGSAELLEVYGNKLERNNSMMQGKKDTCATSPSGKINIMLGLLNMIVFVM